MANKGHPAAIGDIEGGKAPAELLPSDNVTIEHLYQTARWYPGFDEMHELAAKALWSNGLTDENIPQDRILEMKRAQYFAFLCGYVAVVVNSFTDPPSIQMWHPEIEGIGFLFTKFDYFGYPLEITIKTKFEESMQEPYTIPYYPVESMKVQIGKDLNGDPIFKDLKIREKPLPKSYGFFILRTAKGLNGVRGVPQYLQLMHPVRAQSDILNAYVPYAKKQGMGFPAVFLEDNNPVVRNSVKTQMSSQPQTNRLLILSNQDLVEWIQPTTGSYDPTFILQWIDALIARKTQMNKLMLEGDPAGYLSASETAISNWEKEVKENQTFWRAQWQPVWTALGAAEDCGFQDPVRPAFISLMEGLKIFREATDGLVDRQDQLDVINEYLAKSDKQYKLTLAPDEDRMLGMGGMMGSPDKKGGDQDRSARQSRD